MPSEFNFFGLGGAFQKYDFRDKERNVRHYVTYMLNRVQSMFEYKGLPDTIPQKMIELYIMINGHAVIIEHEGELYVTFGNWGGEPNEYYIPRNYIVANPYLNIFKTYTIGEDCVLAHNDSLYYGLVPMFSRYATQLVENDLTMNMVDINSRIVALIAATDDATKASAEKYLADIEAGKNGVIANQAFLDGVKTQPYGEHNYQRLTDLIEYQQYTKASWFNELGLNANYNMKREAITSNESQLNDDMLLPLVDDMLNCRKIWIEQVNEMFGVNWSIDWSSSWKDNQITMDFEQEMQEAKIEQILSDSERSEQSESEDDSERSEQDEEEGGDINGDLESEDGRDNSEDDVSDDDKRG